MDDKDIFSNSEPEESLPESFDVNDGPDEDLLKSLGFNHEAEETDSESFDINSESDESLLNSLGLDKEDDETAAGALDLNSFSAASADNARKKKAKKRRGKERVLKICLTVVLIGVITVSMVLGSFLLYAFTMVDGTMNVDLNDLELNFTTTIYVEDKKTGEWVEYQRLHGEFNRIWMPYDAKAAEKKDNKDYEGIPQQLVDAFIAVEDKRFKTHYGVDWKRTFGAVINTFIPIYSSRQGGSTITQQLVKNLTGDNDTSASRKVREIMRARYLETHYSKDTIIECYLNTIPMGKGAYGVEVAANYYFGKSVSELTLLECASLASITKGPAIYNPVDNPEKNKDRRETVLALMLEEKYITKKEYKAALKEELNIVASDEALKETDVNNYFVDALIVDVTNDLAAKYGWDKKHAAEKFYTGGYKIYTTLDPEIQTTVEEVFKDSETYGLKAGDGAQLQGSFTIMDYKGRVLGMAGGIGEKEGNLSLNRATDSPRQPGSTMKPIAAYTPAIESGMIHYSSMLNDTATKYKNGWTPKNWYGGYWGNVTTQYALERSINTIPVYLVNKMTPQVSYDFLTKDLGITTLKESDIDLAPLGMGGTTRGITTLESAAAYAVFGNGGQYYKPTLYYAVYDQRNEVVLSHEKVKPHTAISEDTATVMNKLLQGVVYGSNGTGRGAAGYIKDMKIFAKTGTSNDSNDLWFVGGTPYYVASCWCGYDTPQTISDSAIAQKMWGAVMTKVHEGLKAKDYGKSSYVRDRYYCTQTGLLATDACPSRAIGWYKKGSAKNGYIPTTCKTHAGTVLGTPDEVKKAEEEAAKKEEEKKPEGETGTEKPPETQTPTPTPTPEVTPPAEKPEEKPEETPEEKPEEKPEEGSGETPEETPSDTENTE